MVKDSTTIAKGWSALSQINSHISDIKRLRVRHIRTAHVFTQKSAQDDGHNKIEHLGYYNKWWDKRESIGGFQPQLHLLETQ